MHSIAIKEVTQIRSIWNLLLGPPAFLNQFNNIFRELDGVVHDPKHFSAEFDFR